MKTVKIRWRNVAVAAACLALLSQIPGGLSIFAPLVGLVALVPLAVAVATHLLWVCALLVIAIAAMRIVHVRSERARLRAMRARR